MDFSGYVLLERSSSNLLLQCFLLSRKSSPPLLTSSLFQKEDDAFVMGLLLHGSAVFRYSMFCIRFHCPHSLSYFSIEQLNCNETL